MNRELVAFALAVVACAIGALAAELGLEWTNKGDRYERPVVARALRSDLGNITRYHVVSPEIAWASCRENEAGGSFGIDAQLFDGNAAPAARGALVWAELGTSEDKGIVERYRLDTGQMTYFDLNADGMIDGAYDRRTADETWTLILHQGRFVRVEPSKGRLESFAWEFARRTSYVFRQGRWQEGGPYGSGPDVGSLDKTLPRVPEQGFSPRVPPAPPAQLLPGQVLPLLEPVPPEPLDAHRNLPKTALMPQFPQREQSESEPRPSLPVSGAGIKEPLKTKDLGPGWTPVDEPEPPFGIPGPPGAGRLYARPVSARAIRRPDGDATEYRITSLVGNEFAITQSDDGRRVAIEIVGHQRFEAVRDNGRVVRCSFRFAKVTYFDLDGDGFVDAFADVGQRRACVLRNKQFVDVAWTTDFVRGIASAADGTREYVFREGRWEKRDPAEKRVAP